MGIPRVDGTDDVHGQPAVGLVLVEGFERAGKDDPAKVPKNGANWLICHGKQDRRA
jgi:hypothetical protein